MGAGDDGGPDGPSASAVLAVAEGLRRRDPQLAAALAEHAARLSHDEGGRGEAELSAVLARRELDRPDEVVERGVPALREAERGGRHRDAAVLRCALADAALSWSDTTTARRLLDPLVTGGEPSRHGGLVLAVARADLAAAGGTVAAVDAVAARADASSSTRDERILAGTDLARARARARRVAGDLPGARELLEQATTEPVPDAVDGGRRHLLVVGELVEVLVALGEPAAARSAAARALGSRVDVVTALPLARLRCAVASGVHLPAGELDDAETLARAVVDDLWGRGHDRVVAGAHEVLAAVAEGRGDLVAALAAQRRAHHLERCGLLAEAGSRVDLAAATVDGAEPADPSPSPGVPGRPTTPVRDVDAAPTVPVATAPPSGRDGVEAPLPSTGRRRARRDADDVGAPTTSAGSSAAPVTPAASTVPRGDHPRSGREPGPDSRGATPHGLTRILDEITADARSRPDGPDTEPTTRRDPDPEPSAERPEVPEVPAGPETPDDPGEYATELRLTLVDLLAEYGVAFGDAPAAEAVTAPTGSARESAPESPPSTVPAQPPTAWSFHDDGAAQDGAAQDGAALDGAGHDGAGHDGAAGGALASGPPLPVRNGHRADGAGRAEGGGSDADGDSGARLADLLAEAMDAFRRAAPGPGTIGPVPPQARPDGPRSPRRWGAHR